MPDQISLLLTRPAAQAGRFAAAAAARLGPGVRIVSSPLLEIVSAPGAAALRDPGFLDGVGALAFTSENAVRIYAERTAQRDLPAYCVGPRTTQAARAAGLTAHDGGGDVAALAETIGRDWHEPGAVLHLRGAHVAGALAEDLAGRGIAARSQIIYDQQPRPLSDAAEALLSGPGIVLVPLFSARSAALIAPALTNARAQVRIAAISPAVARAVRVQSDAQMEIAAEPHADAMLDLLAKLAGAG